MKFLLTLWDLAIWKRYGRRTSYEDCRAQSVNGRISSPGSIEAKNMWKFDRKPLCWDYRSRFTCDITRKFTRKYKCKMNEGGWGSSNARMKIGSLNLEVTPDPRCRPVHKPLRWRWKVSPLKLRGPFWWPVLLLFLILLLISLRVAFSALQLSNRKPRGVGIAWKKKWVNRHRMPMHALVYAMRKHS